MELKTITLTKTKNGKTDVKTYSGKEADQFLEKWELVNI